jgi:non-ribosomal peptide synthetase component F
MPTLTESHVKGATDIPLIELTIGAMLDQTSARWPDHEAIVVCHQGVRWTWAELKQRVDVFAAGLLALGLRPGDRIGIWVAQQHRVGHHAIRQRQGWPDPGDDQPCQSAE